VQPGEYVQDQLRQWADERATDFAGSTPPEDKGDEVGEPEGDDEGAEPEAADTEEADLSPLVEEIKALQAQMDEKIAQLREEDPESFELVSAWFDEMFENPPASVADEATWERAKKAVDPEGKGKRYDEPYAVVMSVYKSMGGELK
jgi:hypothetical protein